MWAALFILTQAKSSVLKFVLSLFRWPLYLFTIYSVWILFKLPACKKVWGCYQTSILSCCSYPQPFRLIPESLLICLLNHTMKTHTKMNTVHLWRRADLQMFLITTSFSIQYPLVVVQKFIVYVQLYFIYSRYTNNAQGSHSNNSLDLYLCFLNNLQRQMASLQPQLNLRL